MRLSLDKAHDRLGANAVVLHSLRGGVSLQGLLPDRYIGDFAERRSARRHDAGPVQIEFIERLQESIGSLKYYARVATDRKLLVNVVEYCPPTIAYSSWNVWLPEPALTVSDVGMPAPSVPQIVAFALVPVVETVVGGEDGGSSAMISPGVKPSHLICVTGVPSS
jgi:hypothetical protein